MKLWSSRHSLSLKRKILNSWIWWQKTMNNTKDGEWRTKIRSKVKRWEPPDHRARAIWHRTAKSKKYFWLYISHTIWSHYKVRDFLSLHWIIFDTKFYSGGPAHKLGLVLGDTKDTWSLGICLSGYCRYQAINSALLNKYGIWEGILLQPRTRQLNLNPKSHNRVMIISIIMPIRDIYRYIIIIMLCCSYRFPSFSPSISIIHCFRQVFQTAYCVHTEVL